MFLGTSLLASAPQDILQLCLGLFLVGYLFLWLVDPQFSIGQRMAVRSSLPVGVLGGVMQGVVGTSGPLAILFLSSQRLARPMLIGTISSYFLANSLVQFPARWVDGLLTWAWIRISTLALVPVWLSLPLGNRAAQRLYPRAFDVAVLALLVVLAIRLMWRGLT